MAPNAFTAAIEFLLVDNAVPLAGEEVDSGIERVRCTYRVHLRRQCGLGPRMIASASS